MAKITISPLGWSAHLADKLLTPLMYLISGTLKESPQRTHLWNSTKLNIEQVKSLSANMLVHCPGHKSNQARYWFVVPILHIPVLGGWRDYVVIEPTKANHNWHVGWITANVMGISKINIKGPVRLLIGPEDTTFFGVNNEGDQIPLQEIDRGKIGNGGPYKNIPLL